jgi:hypothetical protein
MPNEVIVCLPRGLVDKLGSIWWLARKSRAQLILHLVSISPKPNGGTRVEDCTAAERAFILAKAGVLTVSRALELALFMDAKLDVAKVPAK